MFCVVLPCSTCCCFLGVSCFILGWCFLLVVVVLVCVKDLYIGTVLARFILSFKHHADDLVFQVILQSRRNHFD